MRKARGEITKISSLFDKYKKVLKAPQKTVTTTFIEVVDEVIGIKVKPQWLRYTPSNQTLAIIGGGPLKSEINLHKEEILAHMKGRLGEKSAPKVIV